MIHAIHLLLTCVVAALALPCDTPPPSNPTKPDPVIDWLDRLEHRGEKLKSLSADVVYDKSNELTGDEIRTGKVQYQSADESDHPSARFRIDFLRMIIDDAARDQKREYIFDGSWLVEKDHDRKFFQKRQIVAPGEKFDPLDIDGPFPVPIGQKRESVLKRFDVEIVEDADADKLAKSLKLDSPPLHLSLKPKKDAANVEGQKKFEAVDLWIDRDRLVPVKVQTHEGAVTTTVTLRNVKLDTPADDDSFDTTAPKAGEGWRVEISPWQK